MNLTVNQRFLVRAPEKSKKPTIASWVLRRSCGERGIRTPDTVSRIHTFQACSFNHSDTSPKMLWAAKIHKRPALQTFDYTGLYKTFVAMNLNLAYQAYWEKALPVETYLDDLLQAMPKDLEGMDRYLPINQQRVKRLFSRFQLNPEVEVACLECPTGQQMADLKRTLVWRRRSEHTGPSCDARASNGRIRNSGLFRDQNLGTHGCPPHQRRTKHSHDPCAHSPIGRLAKPGDPDPRMPWTSWHALKRIRT